MASSDTDDNDPLIAELEHLANETALLTKLESCPVLLKLLPPTLIAEGEPTYRRARALRAVLMEVVDHAHIAVSTNHQDKAAGFVLAAGAVMGLVTEEPDGYTTRPSKMERSAAGSSKSTRQALAACWLVPPQASERGFRNYQRESLNAFRHALLDYLEDERGVRTLAQRLGTSPIAAPEAPPAEGLSESELSPSWLALHRRQAMAGIVALLVLLGLGLGLGLGLPSSSSPGTGSGSSPNGSTGSGTQAIGLPPGHKTYTEQEGHVGEKWTYTNPFDPADTAPGVQPLQKVRVSCKVYAPSMGSVSPAGYWYRLASAPYDNKDYGIANTYLNGDPVVGTSSAPQINVDRKVPDCPS